MRTSCAAICLSLLLSQLGFAADNELAEGLRLYEELEYNKAEPILDGVLQDSANSDSDRSQAALHLGIIQLALGKEETARQSFHSALSLDRDRPLPPGTSPKIVDIYNAIRAELPAPEPVVKPVTEKPDPSSMASTQPYTTALPPTEKGETKKGEAEKEAEPVEDEPGLLSQWWFWGGVGVAAIAVVAAGVTAAVLLWPKENPDPDDKKEEEACKTADDKGCVLVRF